MMTTASCKLMLMLSGAMALAAPAGQASRCDTIDKLRGLSAPFRMALPFMVTAEEGHGHAGHAVGAVVVREAQSGPELSVGGRKPGRNPDASPAQGE